MDRRTADDRLDSIGAATENYGPEEPARDNPRPLFDPRPIEEAMNAPDPPYLIKNLVRAGDIGLMFGASGTCKTFVALRMAWAVATGDPFLGMRTRRARVMYVAAEGEGGFGKRLRAAAQEYGDPAGFVTYSTDRAALHQDARAVAALIEGVRKAQAELLFLDTLPQLSTGADENNFTDAGALMDAMKRISKEAGCSVMGILHTSKSDPYSERGHTSMPAAADVRIGLSVTDGENQQRRLRIRKVKDGRDGQVFGFDLREIELDLDPEGDPRTSCVVENFALVDGEGKGPSVQPKRMSAGGVVALRALRNAIADAGKPAPVSLGLAGHVRVVSTDQWRDETYRSFLADDPGSKPDTRSKAFRRAVDALQASRHVVVMDGLAWLTEGNGNA